MKYTDRHITRKCCNSLIVGLLTLLMVCLSACSSGDDETSNGSQPNQPTLLYIFLYAPQQAESSRAAYDGDVNPIANESTVYSFKIWVFTHTTNKLIGYYSPIEKPNLDNTHPYELIQLTIDEDYAQTAENVRENVDVYVVGNVTESTCNVTLNETTTRAQLEAVLKEKTTTADPFGLSVPVTSVPANIGLPMTGVLRNMEVKGSAPVLRLDNSGEIARVLLVRTVSKIRFAFCRQTDGETLRINSIKLNSEMIPIAEYLFMTEAEPYDRKTCHINTASGYDTASPELLAQPITEVATYNNPVFFAWGNEELEPEVYEARLDNAAAAGLITQRLFYLRESDKLLQGEIKYQVGSGEEQTATFQMVDAGGFSRNHVWTVYTYLAKSKLHVVTAEVAPWKVTADNYEFYNW